MSKAFQIAAALAALAFAAAADARSPLEGRWAKGKMQIDIKPCGASLCGTVVKASPKQQDRLLFAILRTCQNGPAPVLRGWPALAGFDLGIADSRARIPECALRDIGRPAQAP